MYDRDKVFWKFSIASKLIGMGWVIVLGGINTCDQAQLGYLEGW